MNDLNQITWVEEVNARFRRLSDKDAETWEKIIKNELPSAKTIDIEDAIRLLIQKIRLDQVDKNISVEDIIKAIKQVWWEKKKARGDVQQTDKCALCIGGWMGYFSDSKMQEVGQKENGYYEFGVPCLCSKGRKVLKLKYPGELQNRMTELAEKVKEWKFSISEDTMDDDLLRYAV